MRLTSYNIAVKALNAGSCLSTIVGYMWGFIEQGDVKHAQCAREKALLLDGLICALKRWKPTVKNAYFDTQDTTYASGDFSYPIQLFSVDANAVNVSYSSPLIGEFGDYEDVYLAYRDAVNGTVSKNDDVVQVNVAQINSDLYRSEITFDFDHFGTEDITLTSSLVPNSPTPTVTTTSDPAEDEQTFYCLTDDEVHAILKKIDEICENL